MQRVLIVGAGGHAQVVADILLCAHNAGEPIRPIGYLDDNPDLIDQVLLGLPVLGQIGDVAAIAHDTLIVAVGHNHTRQRLFEQLQRQGESFAIARHPSAIVAADVTTGPGSMICAGVIINPGTSIGPNVILNTACTVDHHNQIGAHVHIAPGSHLGGNVRVGEGALIGIGATIMPGQKVGAWSIVGAAALVNRPVLNHTTVVGVPAKPIERSSQ